MNAEIPHPIRVAIIEDNRFIRKAMEMMLKNEPDFELIGAFPRCEDTLTAAEISRADIVVMDVRLPGLSGIEGVKYLRKNYPQLAVLICTVYEDDEQVYEALAAGAVGFVAKKTQPAELLMILRNVAKGGSPITPNIALKFREIFSKPLTHNRKYMELTETEQKMLEMLSR